MMFDLCMLTDANSMHTLTSRDVLNSQRSVYMLVDQTDNIMNVVSRIANRIVFIHIYRCML